MKFLTKERAPSGCMRRSTPPKGATSTTPCCGEKDDQLLYLTVFAKDLRMYEEE